MNRIFTRPILRMGRVYKLKSCPSVCLCVRHHSNFSTEDPFKLLLMLHRPTKPLSAACLVVSGACLVVSGVPGQNKKISHVYIADKTLKKTIPNWTKNNSTVFPTSKAVISDNVSIGRTSQEPLQEAAEWISRKSKISTFFRVRKWTFQKSGKILLLSDPYRSDLEEAFIVSA